MVRVHPNPFQKSRFRILTRAVKKAMEASIQAICGFAECEGYRTECVDKLRAFDFDDSNIGLIAEFLVFFRTRRIHAKPDQQPFYTNSNPFTFTTSLSLYGAIG
jgi:hypothetical protein